MRKKIYVYGRNILANPLLGSSAIMIVGSNLANFFAYIYHLVMARVLGPSEYGELSAIISLIALISASYGFLNMVIVKMVSASKKNEIENLYAWFTKKTVIIGSAVTVLIILSTPLISSFLHMPTKIIVLVGPIFFFSLMLFVYRSFLQGLLRFRQLVIITNTEMITRLVYGILFIILGLSVFGVVNGILFATITAWFLSMFFLKDYKMRLRGREVKFDNSKFIAVTIPIFIATFANHSLYTTDVVLVKHYFDSYNAGLYAALSNLGKIIFFGTAPVVAVMFPMISKRYSQKQEYKKLFLLSLFLVTLISAIVLIGYLILPNLAIGLLYGQKYLSASGELFWFGLFISLFTVNSLFMNYFLALDKFKVIIFPVLGAIGQILGIIMFHDSLFSVIKVSIVVSSLMLIGLLLYFGHESKKLKILQRIFVNNNPRV